MSAKYVKVLVFIPKLIFSSFLECISNTDCVG
jgi:hypothetical protein